MTKLLAICAAAVATLGLIGCGTSQPTQSTSHTTSGQSLSWPHPSKALEIRVSVEDGRVTTETPSVDVSTGDEIELVITSDVVGTAHNHLNDQSVDVLKGTTTMRFTADKSGVYEVELEESSLTLLQLRVR